MHQLRQRFQQLRNLTRGLAVEASASIVSVPLLSLGYFSTHPIAGTRFVRKGKRKGSVLFVHGFLHNKSAFLYLAQRLFLDGWKNLYALELKTAKHSVKEMANQLAEKIEQIRATHPSDPIECIGHSLGGIVARTYLQLMRGDGSLSHLVTLGTPHQGTPLWAIAPQGYRQDCLPTSPLILQLNRRSPPRKTQVTAICGDCDLFTRSNAHGWWPGVRNIELKGIGHWGVLYSPRVFEIIASRLESSTLIWKAPPKLLEA